MFKLVVFLLQVTRQVFEASKGRLKVVGRAGVGVDNVDLAAATEVRRERGPGAVARKVGTWGDSWAQTSPQSLCWFVRSHYIWCGMLCAQVVQPGRMGVGGGAVGHVHTGVCQRVHPLQKTLHFHTCRCRGH
jgi:hypothetical protein